MILSISTGVITDIDGNFSIFIEGKGGTLTVSYIGYNKQNIRISNQRSVNVRLVPDAEMLEEVIVVGAGTQKKVSVTGAITSIKGASSTVYQPKRLRLIHC